LTGVEQKLSYGVLNLLYMQKFLPSFFLTGMATSTLAMNMVTQ